MQPTLLSAFLLMVTFPHLITMQICTYNATGNKVGFIDCGEPAEDVEGIFIPRGSLPEIKKGLFDSFPKVISIYMGRLNIQKVEAGAFDGLKLTGLQMNQNNLRNIDYGTFNSLNTTKTLEMHTNQIESLGANIFSGMTSLVWLSVSRNQIKFVDKSAFSGLNNLKNLHMIWNKIESLEVGTFDDLVSLQLLDLTLNYLTEIKFGLFAHLRSLEKLILNNNRLESLPDFVFGNLTAIKEIDLSQNRLFELQGNLFYGIENLKSLRIQHNNISRFDTASILARVPNLKEVKLYGNPWKCEELENIRRDFKVKRVISPIPVPEKNLPNVDGVGCSE